MKNTLLPLLFLFLLNHCLAQSESRVGHFDIMKADAKYEQETKHYYEQNWLLFRKEAKKQNAISDYKLMYTEPDSTNTFSIILYTEFQDQTASDNVEEAFSPIMKGLRPNGPNMLNDVKRSEFILSRFSYDVKIK